MRDCVVLKKKKNPRHGMLIKINKTLIYRFIMNKKYRMHVHNNNNNNENPIKNLHRKTSFIKSIVN